MIQSIYYFLKFVLIFSYNEFFYLFSGISELGIDWRSMKLFPFVIYILFLNFIFPSLLFVVFPFTLLFFYLNQKYKIFLTNDKYLPFILEPGFVIFFFILISQQPYINKIIEWKSRGTYVSLWLGSVTLDLLILSTLKI